MSPARRREAVEHLLQESSEVATQVKQAAIRADRMLDAIYIELGWEQPPREEDRDDERSD